MKQILYERLIQYILENQDRFYRILINECLTVIKKRKRVFLTAGDLEHEEVYYEKGYEQDDDIEKELDRLNLDVQTIIRLRFFVLKLGAETIFTDELLQSVEMADIDNFQPSMAGFPISDGGTVNINFGVVDGVLAINGINY